MESLNFDFFHHAFTNLHKALMLQVMHKLHTRKYIHSFYKHLNNLQLRTT